MKWEFFFSLQKWKKKKNKWKWKRNCVESWLFDDDDDGTAWIHVQFTLILPVITTRIWVAATTAVSSQRQQQYRISHSRTFFFFFAFIYSYFRLSSLNLNIKYSVVRVWSSSGWDLQRIFSFKNSTKLKTCCEHISLCICFFWLNISFRRRLGRRYRRSRRVKLLGLCCWSRYSLTVDRRCRWRCRRIFYFIEMCFFIYFI